MLLIYIDNKLVLHFHYISFKGNILTPCGQVIVFVFIFHLISYLLHITCHYKQSSRQTSTHVQTPVNMPTHILPRQDVLHALLYSGWTEDLDDYHTYHQYDLAHVFFHGLKLLHQDSHDQHFLQQMDSFLISRPMEIKNLSTL